MRFVFRLESVLRLRRRDEETAKKNLGLAVAREASERDALRSLEQELSDEVGAQAEARSGEIWAQGQALYLEWTRGQNLRIAAQRSACQEAADAVAKARSALVEARRAVQVLEKLKERRWSQWHLEQNRKEQAFASDVAAQRWMRLKAAP